VAFFLFRLDDQGFSCSKKHCYYVPNETLRKEIADAIRTACPQFAKMSKPYWFTILTV